MPSDLPCEYTGVSMLAAGQSATRTVFPLAALPFASVPTSTTEFLVAEKPHWGLGGKVPIWEPRFPYANHQTPLGLPVCSYDSGRRSRCTGKERDAETGLDFFGARYFSGAQGRFTSTDPIFFQKDMLADPQRWNLYAYAQNNPLRFTSTQKARRLSCWVMKRNARRSLRHFVAASANRLVPISTRMTRVTTEETRMVTKSRNPTLAFTATARMPRARLSIRSMGPRRHWLALFKVSR